MQKRWFSVIMTELNIVSSSFKLLYTNIVYIQKIINTENPVSNYVMINGNVFLIQPEKNLKI